VLANLKMNPFFAFILHQLSMLTSYTQLVENEQTPTGELVERPFCIRTDNFTPFETFIFNHSFNDADLTPDDLTNPDNIYALRLCYLYKRGKTDKADPQYHVYSQLVEQYTDKLIELNVPTSYFCLACRCFGDQSTAIKDQDGFMFNMTKAAELGVNGAKFNLAAQYSDNTSPHYNPSKAYPYIMDLLFRQIPLYHKTKMLVALYMWGIHTKQNYHTLLNMSILGMKLRIDKADNMLKSILQLFYEKELNGIENPFVERVSRSIEQCNSRSAAEACSDKQYSSKAVNISMMVLR
jgi:hypothetical protein